MKTLREALAGNFVVVNLGAAADRDLHLPSQLRSAATLIEVDAAESSQSNASYFAVHKLKSVIAGSKGVRTFRQNAYSQSSSVLDPDERLIRLYRLERYYKPISSTAVNCETLPDVLNECRLQSIDFLKTDLEGMDSEVIRSCSMLLPKILAVQCELRFQPFFSGEPHFHQTASYLVENDFELIDLKPEFWKPATAHQKEHRDGRVVWANCLFVRKPELVSDPVSQAKQIIIASMLNRRCYAEYLCERYQSTLPAEWKAELEQLVVPVKTFRDSGIWKILRCIRDVVSPRPTMEHVAEY